MLVRGRTRRAASDMPASSLDVPAISGDSLDDAVFEAEGEIRFIYLGSIRRSGRRRRIRRVPVVFVVERSTYDTASGNEM